MLKPTIFCAPLLLFSLALHAQAPIRGRVRDPHDRAVTGAVVRLVCEGKQTANTRTDSAGAYVFEGFDPGGCLVRAEYAGFDAVELRLAPPYGADADLAFRQISTHAETIVITAATAAPQIDLRNSETFNRTLFTRDDQALQQLNAGINAGQHEGGGKSLEIRRFGFNLDHGGVNGGLKILVDNVQQNYGTQGHGQGYLGALKAVIPELIQDVTIVNGPFSPEYGDFSGLGVVHIRQREAMPDRFTARLQGGSYNTGRTFLSWSPDRPGMDAYAAYEGSYSDGPFENPSRYRRDNLNANYTRSLAGQQRIGLRFVAGRNDFYSSGQIPLDLVQAGVLDRFGNLDPTGGGRGKLATLAGYYSKTYGRGDTLKLDGFVGRSLSDLYSNFTFFLNDPSGGDAFQQHDSRLQQGVNAQWTHLHRLGGAAATLVGGGNFHDNQINVGLYPDQLRVPTGVLAKALAHVTNGAGFIQENLDLLNGRLLLGAGLRYDAFRYGVNDVVFAERSGAQAAGRWQAKASAAFTPSRVIPLSLHWNYGRGINSADARGVVQKPDGPRLAVTDFHQAGASFNWDRFSWSADAFLIDHSHEQVYVPDDGSFEFRGASRAYGYEAKAAFELTRHLSINGGMTKIGNAFYKGASRVYVDSAPHFVANAALTLAGWRGWSGSLRLRAINHYRLDGEDPRITASGHTVFDLGLARRLSRNVDLNLSLDNLTDREFWETQNYFESRVAPGSPAVSRIHATPGYPITAVAGVTLRFGGK